MPRKKVKQRKTVPQALVDPLEKAHYGTVEFRGDPRNVRKKLPRASETSSPDFDRQRKAGSVDVARASGQLDSLIGGRATRREAANEAADMWWSSERRNRERERRRVRAECTATCLCGHR